MANRIDTWYENLRILTEFNSRSASYPSTLSKDADEKSLATWWARQKYLYKQHKNGGKCSLDERQIASIETIINRNQNLERDYLWNSRFEKIQSQYNTHQTLFSSTSQNIEEVKLMRWWNQQKTSARKFLQNIRTNGMNQERYNRIADLMRSMDQEISATAESVANIG